jgi:hypothetical protein
MNTELTTTRQQILIRTDANKAKSRTLGHSSSSRWGEDGTNWNRTYKRKFQVCRRRGAPEEAWYRWRQMRRQRRRQLWKECPRPGRRSRPAGCFSAGWISSRRRRRRRASVDRVVGSWLLDVAASAVSRGFSGAELRVQADSGRLRRPTTAPQIIVRGPPQ